MSYLKCFTNHSSMYSDFIDPRKVCYSTMTTQALINGHKQTARFKCMGETDDRGDFHGKGKLTGIDGDVAVDLYFQNDQCLDAHRITAPYKELELFKFCCVKFLPSAVFKLDEVMEQPAFKGRFIGARPKTLTMTIHDSVNWKLGIFFYDQENRWVGGAYVEPFSNYILDPEDPKKRMTQNHLCTSIYEHKHGRKFLIVKGSWYEETSLDLKEAKQPPFWELETERHSLN